MFEKTSLGTSVTQSETMSINVPVADIPNIANTASSVIYNSNINSSGAKADIILVPSALFSAVFTQYDANALPVGGQKGGYVQPFHFLSHVRYVNLAGTASASTTDDNDHAYSVVLGPRTSPLDITVPTTVVAHLVNIKGVESITPWPLATTSQYVAMTTLYSWAYTCMPPNSLDIKAAFRHLGALLRPLVPVLTPADETNLANGGAVGARIRARIEDGYSMLRYRLLTGEVSAAFVRGPFTLTTVKFPDGKPGSWPATSTTGGLLQILDDQVNIIDLTYSAAWNLRRTLALSDSSFNRALFRVRKQIFDEGMKLAQIAAIKAKAKTLSFKP
jgi:hypothetical protein